MIDQMSVEPRASGRGRRPPSGSWRAGSWPWSRASW